MTRYGRSPWIDRFPTSRVPSYPRHRGNDPAPVVIVGGGLTGCATAYAFAAAGVKATLLEAGQIGRGNTAAASGWIAEEPGVPFGDLAFPLQVVFMLSRRDVDFTGGEFLLVEQRPRAQSRGHALTIDQGAGVIFATRERPQEGTRGPYRVAMRHGVSTVTSGARMTLGIIFHDAK